MRFCTSNAPSLRNLALTCTSNLESRKLVVCGTRVTKARSLSSAGMLTTKYGLNSQDQLTKLLHVRDYS